MSNTFKTNQLKLAPLTSPDTWGSLRVLYESGEYASIKALYEAKRDDFTDMPDIDTLLDRSIAGCWDKERYTEIKTEVKKRNLIELYASLGMDEREQARYRVQCVRAVDKLKGAVTRLYRKLDSLEPDSETFDRTLGKIKVLSDTMFKGLNTSLTALQDISKLTGDYAPIQTKDVKSHGFKTKNGMKEIEDMSEEEILQDLKRMQRAGIDLNDLSVPETSPDAQRGPNEL